MRHSARNASFYVNSLYKSFYMPTFTGFFTF